MAGNMSPIEFDIKGLPQFVAREEIEKAVAQEREACARYLEQRQFVAFPPRALLTASDAIRSWERDSKYSADSIRRGEHTRNQR